MMNMTLATSPSPNWIWGKGYIEDDDGTKWVGKKALQGIRAEQETPKRRRPLQGNSSWKE